jgi:DNA gyrase/topoisomerase IV subunit B
MNLRVSLSKQREKFRKSFCYNNPCSRIEQGEQSYEFTTVHFFCRKKKFRKMFVIIIHAV